MTYHLAPQTGDTLAVPQLVISNLARADENAVRVALYLLSTRCTDPRTIAHDLSLRSVHAAETALQWWAGVGLLAREAPAAPLAEEPAARHDTGTDWQAGLRDPMVATLTTEAQNCLGKTLGRDSMARLVSLYTEDGYPVDLILLCAAYLAGQNKRTVSALSHALAVWRADGVETGPDGERHIQRETQRETCFRQVAPLFKKQPEELTRYEKRTICRWFEEWLYGTDLIQEALLHAAGHEVIHYVDGILKSWHSAGVQTVSDARGQGTLKGSNVLATGKTGSMDDIFARDWSDVPEFKTEE